MASVKRANADRRSTTTSSVPGNSRHESEVGTTGRSREVWSRCSATTAAYAPAPGRAAGLAELMGALSRVLRSARGVRRRRNCRSKPVVGPLRAAEHAAAPHHQSASRCAGPPTPRTAVDPVLPGGARAFSSLANACLGAARTRRRRAPPRPSSRPRRARPSRPVSAAGPPAHQCHPGPPGRRCRRDGWAGPAG